MSYLNTFKRELCFGCGACRQICPKDAIRMTVDLEGFLYPQIDMPKCISCGKCISTCPMETQLFHQNQICCYVAKSKDPDVLLKSASGGAFYAIVSCSDADTVIFGARWKTRSSVVHEGAINTDAYEAFRKSKYIQSEIGTCYQQIKYLLANGTRVVFTGTPCQVAGLRSFLGTDYENLLCVDLVCHGVSSAKVLERYLQDSANHTSGKIKSISFRTKAKSNGKWSSKFAELTFTSGKTKLVDYNTSAFLRGYDHGLFFRPSCHICPYARANRVSDLTLGDFWGIENTLFDPHQGASLILANTEKGRAEVQRMHQFLLLEEIALETAIKGNARLRTPDRGHSSRKEFFSQIDTYSFQKKCSAVLACAVMVSQAGARSENFYKKEIIPWLILQKYQ